VKCGAFKKGGKKERYIYKRLPKGEGGVRERKKIGGVGGGKRRDLGNGEIST